MTPPAKHGPYIARAASDHTDDWPFWYVAGPNGTTNYLTALGGRETGVTFVSREKAQELARIWNTSSLEAA